MISHQNVWQVMEQDTFSKANRAKENEPDEMIWAETEVRQRLMVGKEGGREGAPAVPGGSSVKRDGEWACEMCL